MNRVLNKYIKSDTKRKLQRKMKNLDISPLRVRLVRRETGLSPPVKYFTDRSKTILLLWIFYVFCFAFAMPLCASFYCALWSPAGKGLTLGSSLWCLKNFL